MQKNLRHLFLLGLLSLACTLVLDVYISSLMLSERALLGVGLFFAFLFYYEVLTQKPPTRSSEHHDQHTLNHHILNRLDQLTQSKEQLSEEIERKISRLIHKNMERFEVTEHHQTHEDIKNHPSPLNTDAVTMTSKRNNVLTDSQKLESFSKGPQHTSDYFIKPQKETPQKFFSKDVLIDTIHQALKTDQIETRLQPIVSLPQRKKRFFVATSQLRGLHQGMITPEHYIDLAEELSLIRIIDNAILMKCVSLARHSAKKDLNIGYFLNLSIKTVQDQEFIDSLSEFIEINSELAERLVFCLEAKAMRQADESVMRSLKGLGSLGCQFALTHVNSFDLDFSMLRKFRVRFLKIEQTILHTFLKEHGLEKVKIFKHHAYLHQVDLIATHIETEQAYTSILDFDCDYGQGFLFGKPELI